MKQINIKYRVKPQEDLCVVVNGVCNHAICEVEHDTYDIVEPDGIDQSVTEEIWVCTRCGAYRNPNEDYWWGQGVEEDV